MVFFTLELMELQIDEDEHLRLLLVYEFNRDCNATQVAWNISAVYGQGFITG